MPGPNFKIINNSLLHRVCMYLFYREAATTNTFLWCHMWSTRNWIYSSDSSGSWCEVL